MAAKITFVCALALFGQAAFAQYIAPGSYVSGNSVVDNNIYVSGSGSGYGAGLALGGGSSGLAIGSGSGYALGGGSAGLALGGGSSGLAIGSGSGYALGSGIGLSSGLGLSTNLGTIGVSAPAISSASLGGLSNWNVVSGGPLAVTAISPIGPSGLAVASENVLEGTLLVTGQLPFLSAVAFEGALPTAGSGVATCGCGSGTVGITSEGLGRPGNWY